MQNKSVSLFSPFCSPLQPPNFPSSLSSALFKIAHKKLLSSGPAKENQVFLRKQRRNRIPSRSEKTKQNKTPSTHTLIPSCERLAGHSRKIGTDFAADEDRTRQKQGTGGIRAATKFAGPCEAR
jgi:hypothetical protein